jgi:hypothetical protein
MGFKLEVAAAAFEEGVVYSIVDCLIMQLYWYVQLDRNSETREQHF